MVVQNDLSLVQFTDVSFRYKHAYVLQDISFEFLRYHFYFLVGKSGAGKTSFLKLIYRSLLPTEGEITIFGHDTRSLDMLTLPKLRQQIGIVQEDNHFFDHLTILENTILPLTLQQPLLSSYRARLYAEELLTWVGLEHIQNSYPKALSNGQKQRAAIARAVIGKPKLIVADEPTAGVDAEQAHKLILLLNELVKIGTTVILATHDDGLALKNSIRITLKGGTFTQDSVNVKCSIA